MLTNRLISQPLGAEILGTQAEIHPQGCLKPGRVSPYPTNLVGIDTYFAGDDAGKPWNFELRVAQ